MMDEMLTDPPSPLRIALQIYGIFASIGVCIALITADRIVLIAGLFISIPPTACLYLLLRKARAARLAAEAQEKADMAQHIE
jgi:hypothetical protein